MWAVAGFLVPEDNVEEGLQKTKEIPICIKQYNLMCRI